MKFTNKVILYLAVLIGLSLLSDALDDSRPESSATKRIRKNQSGSSSPVIKEKYKSKLPKILDFSEYIVKFNKAYDSTELVHRAKLFISRVLTIFKHNARFLQRKVNHYLALNQFTDSTPEDIKAMSETKDSALVPVLMADMYPDMPASRLSSVVKLTGDEGVSMSPARGEEVQEDWSIPKRKSLVDFRSSKIDENLDIKTFYKKLRMSPKDARKLSVIVDLGQKNNQADERAEFKIDPVSERAIQQRKIRYKPIVESSNRYYDLNSIPSQGVFMGSSPGSVFSSKLAKFLEYESDFASDLETTPYERASPPQSPGTLSSSKKRSRSDLDDDVSDDDVSDDDTEEDNEVGGTFISSLFSARKIYKSMKNALKFSNLFDVYDLEDDSDSDESDSDDDEDEDDTESENRHKGDIKYRIDWRITGCITAPKSQKSCNSCYAFTVMSLMEFYYCKQSNTITEFSAQYIIDCGSRVHLNGCKSGTLGNTGKFIQNYGIELSSMYPYKGTEGQCPYGMVGSDHKRMGYLRPMITSWRYFNEMAHWYTWLRKGPLIVGIGMPADFAAYGGGIHDGLDCDPNSAHAMLLVGSGSEDGQEFWLLKNSYSALWGEQGYFRLSKDAPLKCFNSGVAVRAEFRPDRIKKLKMQT